jgi:hypothetical protein
MTRRRVQNAECRGAQADVSRRGRHRSESEAPISAVCPFSPEATHPRCDIKSCPVRPTSGEALHFAARPENVTGPGHYAYFPEPTGAP